jgi:two-component system, LuxR family, sensor kinase FixL
MNWIDIAWTIMASASLTLGLIHLLVWNKGRAQYAHLVFFALATSVAIFGGFELLAARAQTPGEYARALRWAQVPLTVFALAILAFVHLYFNAGRPWLAYVAAGLRLLTLLLNFVTGVNANFRDITELVHVTLWGGAVVSVPVGVLNPWNIVPQLSNALIVAFVVDASVSLWRRGGVVPRRRALIVGGSLALSILVASGMANLSMMGLVRAPILLTPCFLIVVLAMGYELSWDVIAAAQLAAKLQTSEMSLRASEEQFRAVVESVPNAILLVDGQGKVTLTNPPAHALFGYAREELIGRPVELLIPARYRSSHEAYRQSYGVDARARVMGFGRELYALHKEGSEVPVEVVLKPMRMADALFVLVSLVDITERRQNERTAARQRDEIAHLSRVATLGELSGSLAHEINQPLMGILSNAQAALRFLARDDADLDEVREILVDIVEDDKRAGEVIRRLRALLKKGEMQHRPLDIGSVIDDVLRLTRNDLMNRDVAVSTELTPDLPLVLGDRIQLQQVLLNLVLNACEAMDAVPGTPRVHIRTLRTEGAGVEISVSDRGGGIPPGDLERIFEPFVTTKELGIGLGLSICRTIIIAHGGRLWAENIGEGATFRFTLPLSHHAE